MGTICRNQTTRRLVFCDQGEKERGVISVFAPITHPIRPPSGLISFALHHFRTASYDPLSSRRVPWVPGRCRRFCRKRFSAAECGNFVDIFSMGYGTRIVGARESTPYGADLTELLFEIDPRNRYISLVRRNTGAFLLPGWPCFLDVSSQNLGRACAALFLCPFGMLQRGGRVRSPSPSARCMNTTSSHRPNLKPEEVSTPARLKPRLPWRRIDAVFSESPMTATICR